MPRTLLLSALVASCNAPAPPPPSPGWVSIKPGSFEMGSPSSEIGYDDNGPPHKVTITHGFWLKATEVTQGEWLALMGSSPSSFEKCGPTCPVSNTTWYEAVAYCNALSKKEGLAPCYSDGAKAYDAVSAEAQRTPAWPKGLGCVGYRLPTEAEWEYAARAGTKTTFYTGDVRPDMRKVECEPDANLEKAAWYCDNSEAPYAGCSNGTRYFGGPACGGTHPVAAKAANAWGLYDMLGNVEEWVWDWDGSYSPYAAYDSEEQWDPVGPSSGWSRVLRGGYWGSHARACGAAVRRNSSPGSRYASIGFRPARSVP